MKINGKSRAALIAAFGLLFVFASDHFPLNRRQNSRQASANETINLDQPYKLCFNRQIGNRKITNIASDNVSSLFVTFSGGKIAKINLTDNPIVWASDLGGEIASELILDGQRIYLFTRLSNTGDKISSGGEDKLNYILWALNAETGLTEWQLPFVAGKIVSLESFRDKLILIVKSGVVISVTKNFTPKISTGNFERFSVLLPGFSENKIYFGTESNSILVADVNNFDVISKISTLQSPVSSILTVGEKLFWGEKKGFVNFFDIEDQRLVWSVRYGGEISSLSLTPKGVLASSLDNFIYLITLQNGKRVWKKRLAGRISATPLIIDNAALFVTDFDQNAVVLDLKNGRTINQISLAETGFILAKPIVFDNSLIFLTNRGIFSFIPANSKCSLN